MNILLTGHTGYLGSVLGALLKQAGYPYTSLMQTRPGTESTIRKDIRELTPADLEGFDTVIHLAAISKDEPGNAGEIREINERAAIRLANYAKEAGVKRFLFASSSLIYGKGGADLLTEDAPANPLTAYARAKWNAEQHILSLAAPAFAPVVLRNATLFGVSPAMRYDLVLNNLVAWAFTTGRIHLNSDGKAWRSMIHVQDAAKIYLAALQATPEILSGKVFHVCLPAENYSIRTLAERVKAEMEGTEIEMEDKPESDSRSFRLDASRLFSAFPDLRPKWTISAGIRELRGFYSKSGLTQSQFFSFIGMKPPIAVPLPPSQKRGPDEDS
jgi:nucleoside-diphosphate-sugar epimerase